MDLLQLEHFLAVVDERTFTRAAERVCRTQPAVSHSIKKLEEDAGAPLFSRDLHDVSLTEAGRVLEQHARKMLQIRDQAMRELDALKHLQAGTLNVAAHESAAVYLLPAPLRCFLGRFPTFKIGIYRSRLAEIPRQVMDREVDLGFVKDDPGCHELKCVEVHLDRMTLVAPPGHSLSGRSNLRIRDLGNEHFVLHHLCSTTQEIILRLFDQHHTRCHIVAELWSFENIKTFVLADVGIAIVPRITVADELRRGTLVEVPVRELDFPRRTLMIYRDHVSEPASELMKIVSGFNWDANDGAGIPRQRPALARVR